jgi:Domain of unknown function (DUF397)
VTDTQIDSGHFEPTGLTWRKASSCPNNAACVEIATLPEGGIGMRDGKEPGSAHLSFGAARWTEFLSGVRAGEFDRSAGDH